jgi:hypothetical protein
MAYCASIAEQFEAIQRWIAGGNSSGVGSAQGDGRDGISSASAFERIPREADADKESTDQGAKVCAIFAGARPLS